MDVDGNADQAIAGDTGEDVLARLARAEEHREDLLLAVHREVRLAAEGQVRPTVGAGVALRLAELVERRRRAIDQRSLHRAAARRSDMHTKHERVRAAA